MCKMIDLDNKNLLNSPDKSDFDLELSCEEPVIGKKQQKKSTHVKNMLKKHIGSKIDAKSEKFRDSDNLSYSSIGLSKTLKRGPYRKYSQKIKQDAVNMAYKLNDPNKAASVFKLPVKNLRRWIKLGTEKKKGKFTRRPKNKRS